VKGGLSQSGKRGQCLSEKSSPGKPRGGDCLDLTGGGNFLAFQPKEEQSWVKKTGKSKPSEVKSAGGKKSERGEKGQIGRKRSEI